MSGSDELSDTLSRVAEVNSHGVSLSMITSVSKMLLIMIVLVGGRFVSGVLLWKEWKQNLPQRSCFCFSELFILVVQCNLYGTIYAQHAHNRVFC